MLANGRATDEVLGRHEHGFDVEVEGRVVVNMGTMAPAYSHALGAQLAAGGARFAEAPVSG
jgi:3-hydroxyisobutyrate dehydrogenase